MGNFPIKKSRFAFSAIAIDQAHEESTASVKDNVGSTCKFNRQPSSFVHWMVSGPEMALVIGEFEGSIEKKQNRDCSYDEQNNQAQTAFA